MYTISLATASGLVHEVLHALRAIGGRENHLTPHYLHHRHAGDFVLFQQRRKDDAGIGLGRYGRRAQRQKTSRKTNFRYVHLFHRAVAKREDAELAMLGRMSGKDASQFFAWGEHVARNAGGIGRKCDGELLIGIDHQHGPRTFLSAGMMPAQAPRFVAVDTPSQA